MHKVADVTVAKNIMEANKKLADKNKERFDKRDMKNILMRLMIRSG